MDNSLLKKRIDEISYAIENVGGCIYSFEVQKVASLKEIETIEDRFRTELPTSFKEACLNLSKRVALLGEINGSIDSFDYVEVFWDLKSLHYELFNDNSDSKKGIEKFLNQYHKIDSSKGFFNLNHCDNGDVVFISELSGEVFCQNFRTLETIKLGNDFLDYISSNLNLFGLAVDYRTSHYFSTDMKLNHNCQNSKEMKEYLSIL